MKKLIYLKKLKSLNEFLQHPGSTLTLWGAAEFSQQLEEINIAEIIKKIKFVPLTQSEIPY